MARRLHLRAGHEYIAAGMFVIPRDIHHRFEERRLLAFHIDEVMNYVKPREWFCPRIRKHGSCLLIRRTGGRLPNRYGNGSRKREAIRLPISGRSGRGFPSDSDQRRLFLYRRSSTTRIGQEQAEGKLRLMYEASVVSFMCCEAGGSAVDEEGMPILNIVPEKPHQRTALYLGSKPLVEDISSVLKKARS